MRGGLERWAEGKTGDERGRGQSGRKQGEGRYREGVQQREAGEWGEEGEESSRAGWGGMKRLGEEGGIRRSRRRTRGKRREKRKRKGKRKVE